MKISSRYHGYILVCKKHEDPAQKRLELSKQRWMRLMFDRMTQKCAKAAVQTTFLRFSMIWPVSAHKRAGMSSTLQWLWHCHWGKRPLSCPCPLQRLWKRFMDHKVWLLLYFSGWRNGLEKFSSQWLFSKNPVEPADPSTFSQSHSVFTQKMKRISIYSDQSELGCQGHPRLNETSQK